MTARKFLTRASRKGMGWATLAAAVAAMSSILLLALSGWFLTAAAIAGAAGTAAAFAFNYLIPSATIRLLAVLRTGSRYGERLLSHRAALLAMAELRGTIFRTLAAHEGRASATLASGDASARLLGDIDALEDLVIRQPTRIAGLAAAATGLLLAAFVGWRAALALALMLASLPILLSYLAHWLTAAPARIAAEALGEVRTSYVEYASARAEIAAYGLAGRLARELDAPTARLDAARARLFVGEGVIAAGMLFYGGCAVALMLILARGPAAYTALAGLAAVAAIEAMAAVSRTALRRAGVEQSLRRLALLKALPAAPATFAAAPTVPAMVGIGGVKLAPGTRVVVLGCSGSGKTMLLESLAGIRGADVDATVNGIAPAACNTAILRAQFALAAQDAPMLAGTIADNLRLARSGVTEQEMWSVLRVACLDLRVTEAPAGLETPLGEAGGILSGGERKRLSLARALLAGRPWLLLDEPTEGLDPATETQVTARLGAWLDATGTGLILVSHRPLPLMLATTRIAMDDIGHSGKGEPESPLARRAALQADAESDADDKRVEMDPHALRSDGCGVQPCGSRDLNIFDVEIGKHAA